MDIQNQYLVYNQYIQIDKKHIKTKQAILKPLLNIKKGNIINSRKSIMSHTELLQKYSINIDAWK